MTMTLILIIIAIGSIGIGAVMAAAFAIPEDEPEEELTPADQEYVDGPLANPFARADRMTRMMREHVDQDDPLDAEVARWQQALERTYERQGIRRNR